MKCVLLCLVLCCAVSTFAYPQRVTLVGIPRSEFPWGPYDTRASDFEDESEEGTVIGGRAPSAYEPSEVNPYYYSSSMSEIMKALQDMMINLRQEMNEILRRIPDSSKEEGEDSELPLIPGIDLNNAKNQSTSKTEVIDGQVYTVNETVITSGNKGIGSVFRVKTIQVRPTEAGETVSTDVEPKETTPGPNSETPAEPTSEAPILSASSNDDKNEIPNDKVGSEIEDLNKEFNK